MEENQVAEQPIPQDGHPKRNVMIGVLSVLILVLVGGYFLYTRRPAVNRAIDTVSKVPENTVNAETASSAQVVYSGTGDVLYYLPDRNDPRLIVRNLQNVSGEKVVFRFSSLDVNAPQPLTQFLDGLFFNGKVYFVYYQYHPDQIIQYKFATEGFKEGRYETVIAQSSDGVIKEVQKLPGRLAVVQLKPLDDSRIGLIYHDGDERDYQGDRNLKISIFDSKKQSLEGVRILLSNRKSREYLSPTDTSAFELQVADTSRGFSNYVWNDSQGDIYLFMRSGDEYHFVRCSVLKDYGCALLSTVGEKEVLVNEEMNLRDNVLVVGESAFLSRKADYSSDYACSQNPDNPYAKTCTGTSIAQLVLTKDGNSKILRRIDSSVQNFSKQSYQDLRLSSDNNFALYSYSVADPFPYVHSLSDGAFVKVSVEGEITFLDYRK